MLTYEYYINIHNGNEKVTIGYNGIEAVWDAYTYMCSAVSGTEARICLWDGATGEVLDYNWEDEEEA